MWKLVALGWIGILVMFATVDADEYILGAEDMLHISVWGEPTLTVDVPIRPDGMITFMPLGDVPAVGRTPAQLATELTQKLSQYIRTAPQVSVTVTAFKSWKLSVFGAVAQPGKYSFASPPSLIEALMAAGSTTPAADMEHLRIIPQDPQQPTQQVNLQRFLESDITPALPELHAGDTIYVPSVAAPAPTTLQPVPPSPGQATPAPGGQPTPATFIVNIFGNVPMPGSLSFNRPVAIPDVLAQAGGTIDEFTLRNLRVIKAVPPGQMIPVDMQAFLATGDLSLLPELQSGDTLYVPGALPIEKNRLANVTVLGYVQAPGSFPIPDAVTLLEALVLAGGINPQGDPKHIQIMRDTPEALQLREANLEAIQQAQEPNLILEPGDVVVVAQKTNYATQGATLVGNALRVLRDVLFVYSTILVLKP